MHLQHRPRLNLISRRMVVGVGRSPAGMDRCVWVNGTLASCASGSSRRCPGQRSLTEQERTPIAAGQGISLRRCRVNTAPVIGGGVTHSSRP